MQLTASYIRDYLKSYLDEWAKLQSAKDDYTLEELNNIYYDFGKQFLDIREELKNIILKDRQLFSDVNKLMAKDLIFDILIDGWSNDINRKGEHSDSLLPLLPFPHQIELLNSLQYSKKHVHVQKSRRQGASVFTSYFMSWLLKHGQNLTMFATHKDLESLDGGLTDIALNSTFGRIRFYLDKSILTPDDWQDNKKYWTRTNRLYKTGEKEIVFGTNVLKGAVLGKATSVGFGGDYIFVDELDVVCDLFPNQSDAIFGSFATAVNRIVLFSTYRGMDYPFYRIWEQNDVSKWDFITLNWHDNPVCNRAWYEEQCSKMNYDEVLIAREIDINPSKTRLGVVWNTIDELNFKKMYGKTYDTKQFIKVVGADFGGGSSETAFIFGYLDKTTGHLWLHELLKTTSMDEYQIQEHFKKLGFFGVPIFGDMSAHFQAGSPKHDWLNVLRKVGIHVTPVYNKDPHKTRAIIRRMFANNEIYINKDHLLLKRDLMSASYKNENLAKDSHSHTADALLYLVRHIFSEDSGLKMIHY